MALKLHQVREKAWPPKLLKMQSTLNPRKMTQRQHQTMVGATATKVGTESLLVDETADQKTLEMGIKLESMENPRRTSQKSAEHAAV